MRKYNLRKLIKVAKSADIIIDSYEVEDYKDLISMERDFLDGITINIDSPIGSDKKFAGAESRGLPFDYGELLDIINPADGDPWDIIIVPSQSGKDLRQSFQSYEFVGVVKYNKNEKDWEEESDIDPPGNNHKLIISLDREYSAEDKEILEDFFNTWQFENIIWF